MVGGCCGSTRTGNGSSIRAQVGRRAHRGCQPRAPKVLAGHPIPVGADGMPNALDYDPAGQILSVGDGRIEPVSPQVWGYSVGNKRILAQWFSYRRQDRERPTMG